MISEAQGLVIDGRHTEATDGRTFSVEDPSTGSVIGVVADAAPEDGVRAVAAAEAAFEEWSSSTPRARSEVLHRAYEQMNLWADELAELIVLENGKSLADAKAEVAYAAEFFRWYAEEAVRNRGTFLQAPSAPGRNILTMHQAAGVALLVTPWNLPAAMVTRKVAPALAAGCTVVVKPSFQTPLTALRLVDLLREAGVPEGVVNVVPTTRDEAVVARILAEPAVRVLSFTGSTEVGRALLRSASDRVINCAMELGGNAPFIVCADADLERAVADAVTAKMRHNAEACIAANRIYVHRSVEPDFTRALAARLDELVVGPGLEPATQVGPLISRSFRDRVDATVGRAVASGAVPRTQVRSLPDDGHYFAPVVLGGVRPDDPLLAHELFAPVAPVVAFDDDAQVVDYANRGELGLGSYVHSRDVGRALRIAERLQAGMVGINTGLLSDPAAPFGGAKQSGIGREGGVEGMQEFQETKYISVGWS